MSDEFPVSIRDAILAAPDRAFLAAPEAPAEPLPTATGYLTREMVDAAIARLMEVPMCQPDPVRVQAELALARWLDEQPPGTAEKLLRQMYGEAEEQR